MRMCILGIAIAWVAAGCGSSGFDPTGGVIPPSVTLQDVQTQVFSGSCATSQCHLGPNAPFGLDLGAGESFGNLVGVASAEVPSFMRVRPFDAADSYLYMKVTGDPRIQGDPMPFQSGPLAPEAIALIEDWIEQGAQP